MGATLGLGLGMIVGGYVAEVYDWRTAFLVAGVPGMVLAVDGSVSVPGRFRAQVGDSIVVTDSGWEPLTRFPKTIADMVVRQPA